MADVSAEVRLARAASGLSQDEIGRRAGLSGDKIWRLEHDRLTTLSITDACVIAAVLGLDFAVRLYPNGASVRDAVQAPRLLAFLSNIGAPLTYRTEVPLPRLGEMPELRAWDALIRGGGERTGIEFESRITDLQATTRRHNQKRVDDPVEHFVLLVAGTKNNRHVMNEFAGLFGDLNQLRSVEVLSGLREGRHPPTGWMYI